MAVNENNWGSYSRSNMLSPSINIDVGTKLLADSTQRVKQINPSADIAQIASNYNNQRTVTVTTDYGRRVESFYNWFGEHYIE